uniref:Uncharacterized protein n=1 Tax=Anopheles melas TaxID=34690 RepID=A0A182TZ38_9DIPT
MTRFVRELAGRKAAGYSRSLRCSISVDECYSPMLRRSRLNQGAVTHSCGHSFMHGRPGTVQPFVVLLAFKEKGKKKGAKNRKGKSIIPTVTVIPEPYGTDTFARPAVGSIQRLLYSYPPWVSAIESLTPR